MLDLHPRQSKFPLPLTPLESNSVPTHAPPVILALYIVDNIKRDKVRTIL